jgi:hypothetical protein
MLVSYSFNASLLSAISQLPCLNANKAVIKMALTLDSEP